MPLLQVIWLSTFILGIITAMDNSKLELVEVFPWNANFETGIPLIDEQHKKLVQLLNTLAAHLAQQSVPVVLDQVFNELAEYAEYHFQSEENIWQSHFNNDNWFTGHQHTHEVFFKSVQDLRESGSEKPLDRVVEEVIKFLTHWLAFHILDSDMRMAKTIRAIETGLLLEQAKDQANREMSGVMKVLIDTVLGMYDNLTSRTLELVKERTERIKMEAEVNELHEKLKEHEKREIYLSTVQASQHILNNLLNQLQLFQIEARKSADFNKDVLKLFDGALAEASDLVLSLSNVKELTRDNIKKSVTQKQ